MSKDFWNALLPSEQRRCRYCRGCIFFSRCDCFGSCDYFLKTGKRRPSKAGTPNCPVRQETPGYVLSEKHREFCARVDAEIKAEEAAERARQRREQRRANKQTKRDADLTEEELQEFDADNPDKERKQGRPLSWDAQYGFKLFMEGYYFFEIADILGVARGTVTRYAILHDWQDKYPQGQTRHRHDIVKAINEYEQFRKQKPQHQKPQNTQNAQNVQNVQKEVET